MSVIRAEGNVGTFIAGADLSKNQYFAVKADSVDGQVVLPGAAQNCIGLLINTPTATNPAEVVLEGGTKAILGDTVSFGNYLESDASGKLVASTADKSPYIAVAMQAGVSGDIIEVYVKSGFLAA
jgi:hypothetical protein